MVLKPIREMKKTCLSAWKGHQTSGAQAPKLWCLDTRTLVPLPHFCCCLINAHLFMLAMFEEEKNCFCKHFAYKHKCKTLLLCSNFHLNELPLWKLSQRNILIEVLVDKGSTRAVVESSRIILLASTTPARYWGLLVISAPTKLHEWTCIDNKS